MCRPVAGQPVHAQQRRAWMAGIHLLHNGAHQPYLVQGAQLDARQGGQRRLDAPLDRHHVVKAPNAWAVAPVQRHVHYLAVTPVEAADHLVAGPRPAALGQEELVVAQLHLARHNHPAQNFALEQLVQQRIGRHLA